MSADPTPPFVPASRARRGVRPLVGGTVVVALVVSFLAGTRVGAAGPSGGVPPRSDVRPAAFRADLDPATGCDELLRSYRERGLARVTAWGWDGGPVLAYRAEVGDATMFSPADGTELARMQASSRTGTNVQETGVDEPDTVKTDGTRVVRLQGDDLVVHDASGTTMRRVGSLHLPKIDRGELLLADDVVMVVGEDRTSARDDATGGRRGTRVVSVSLTDPTSPRITADVTYDGRVQAVRQHGEVARVVLAAGLPALDFVRPDGRRMSEQQALTANRRLVSASTLDDWLPSYDAGEGSRRLTACTDVAVPADELGLDTVTVVGIEMSRPTEPQAIGLAGSAPIAYESDDHLYLVATPSTVGCLDCRGVRFDGPVRDSGGASHVFDFALDGVAATHVASGEVEGTIADRWSLDEVDDVLRVAVGPSSETGAFNSVVTLRRDGTRLVEAGRLDQLGRHEQIKAVRWFDDLAILVTYRQVDPLYSIDLSRPDRPRLLGELKIPGFSDYLHPLGDDQMLGVGFDDRGSAQIALFDSTDLSDVERDDVVGYPRSVALATSDPRAFTWLPERRTALTVLRKGRGVDLATVTVRGDRLVSSTERVEYGSDGDLVRTIELADGRVALVTGEDVRLLDLP